jgi:SSS family solute:Na+ symporter
VWTLASIFSAELSATDAILFMLSTSLAVDLFKTFLKPKISEHQLLVVSRVTSAGAGVVGILLAIALPSIIAAISIFYGLIAVSLLVPVVAGVYSKRVLSFAAVASILSAIAVTVIVSYATNGQGIGILSPQAVGILTAAAVMIGFRVLHPGQARNNLAFTGGTDSR